nr:30S ribosomal protein S3, small subunit ribosomal protein S3 [uncultured archaeon]
MIEREFIREKTKYLKVKEHINLKLDKAAGVGRITIERTPMGEKIIIDAVKPGLVIGRGGQTISALTTVLKEKFKLENPQIEVHEIVIPAKYASVVAKKIAADLERFGPARFKAIGYRSLSDIMNAGALGAEITISGRGVPSSKARKWRFPIGYMKKSGQIALEFIDKAEDRAK